MRVPAPFGLPSFDGYKDSTDNLLLFVEQICADINRFVSYGYLLIQNLNSGISPIVRVTLIKLLNCRYQGGSYYRLFLMPLNASPRAFQTINDDFADCFPGKGLY